MFCHVIVSLVAIVAAANDEECALQTRHLLDSDSDGSQVFDDRLTAYWDKDGCGPHGNDHNWQWCNEKQGQCKAEVQVSQDICPSGLATLNSMQGTGADAWSSNCNLVIEGCTYCYFAQYVCTDACGGAGVSEATCNTMGCVYVSADRVEQCNYGGNIIQDWGCYAHVSDNCEPKIQAGSAQSDDTRGGTGSVIKQHNFQLVFAQTPVVSATLTAKDGAPATVQIFDVTKSGFKYAVVEPHPHDGKHASETVNFVAAVPGTHTLTEGITMVAGSVSTVNTVGHAVRFQVGAHVPGFKAQTGQYETVTFADGVFSEQPALLTGITSTNNAEVSTEAQSRQPWLVPAVTELTATGFKVSMDRCEVKAGTISAPETIGYIALTPGQGRCQKTSCLNAMFSVQNAKTSVQNQFWKNANVKAVSFPESFDNDNVIVISGMSTRNGPDGGWLRILQANRLAVKVIVDEDNHSDQERKHLNIEDVGVVAFSEPFVF